MNTEERNKIDGDLSVGHDLAVGGEAIVQGNTHLKGNVRIDGYLDATNFKYPQVGLYSDINRLYKAHPHPRDGWWAIVGDTIPGEIYVGENGIWKATGQIGGQPTIEGQPILQLISELQTALDATTSVANGALQEDKFNEKLNADEDFNKLKTRVSDTAAVAGGALQAGDLNNALLNTGAFQGISKEIEDTGTNLGIAIDRITVVEDIQAGPIPVDKFENALVASQPFKDTTTAINNNNLAIAETDGKITKVQEEIDTNVLKKVNFDNMLTESQPFIDANTAIGNANVAIGTINENVSKATDRIKTIEDNGITKGNLDANLLESQPFKDTNNAVAVAQDTADTAQETATGALSAAGAAQTLANTVSSNLATTNQNLTAAVGRISTAETNITTATNTANAAKTTADNALPSASFTQANLVSKLGTTYLKPSEFNAKLQADDTFKTAQTNITTAKNKADTAYDRATSAGQAAVSAQETADSAQSTATEAKNGLALKLDTSKAGETLVAQMSINSSGKWVANGVVLGQATGAQGPQGEAGAKGADGKTWKPTVATDGTLTWAQDTSTTAPTSRNIRGPQGVQGVAGAKGDKGQSGIVDKVKNANLVSYNRILQAGFTYATLFDGEWFTIKTNLLETQTYTAKKDMFGLVYKENTQYAITATADERWTWRINIHYTDGTTDTASLSFNGSTAQVTKQVITASGKTVDRLTGYWPSSAGQAKMRVKIEEGTTYTAWSPSPDDATDTMRLYDSQGIIEITNDNYTKFQVTYSGTNYIEPAKLGRTVLFGSGYSQSSTTVNFEYPEKYEGREMTVINNSSVEIAYRGCMQPVTDDTPNWDSAALPYCSTYTQPPKTLCVWRAARYKTKIDSTYVSGISWFLYDIKDYF